jgi:ABC-type Fe3+ transport system substrate-binding protein
MPRGMYGENETMITTNRLVPLVAAVAGVAVLSIGGALAADVSPALQKVIEGAKKEGKIELSSGPRVLGSGTIEPDARAAIKAMYGVDLDFRFTPGPAMGAMGNKLRTEFRAGQKASTDVWTAAAAQAEPLLAIDMFIRPDWPGLLPGRITANIVEGNGRALGVTTGMPGILYNKQRAPEFAKIERMDDLLKPEWKGKFATTPYAAGVDVLAGKSVWGEEKTIEYMKKLAPQVQGLLGCGGEDRIASGEFLALAIDCIGAAHHYDQFKNILDLHVVPDNAQRRPYYILIPKNAPNPNAAILYSVFLSTPEGQKLQAKHWGFDLYEYPDSQRRAEIDALEKKGIKFRDITIDWWADNEGIDKSHAKLIGALRSAAR